ncbi:putative mit domain-containing protein [Phaeoacremonium minimum UCRPA7]|uniref:Putative mit domain-containing protein n=1 Tax=Phaeoacremonium minimum (strain UCR-PA7) TaxID=1286976 RepID=R8BGQ2_PHAM7|nr:putative mit domain-containing protein [Phaeoacremonium minimum UCRPA7]EON98520.1 putative mit domain-containing protein [Phaeoacremonium minimum UCRPA7]
MGYRRKHIRGASGDTEAEFDAALDDAIEAAYDDGYDPMDAPDGRRIYDDDDDVVAKAMRKVELAKERVRQSEREAEKLENERERRRMEAMKDDEPTLPEDFYDGNDSDDEERMLEEMTKGYAIEQFAFGKPIKPLNGFKSADSNYGTLNCHRKYRGPFDLQSTNPSSPATNFVSTTAAATASWLFSWWSESCRLTER